MKIWSNFKQTFSRGTPAVRVGERELILAGETAHAVQNLALRRGMTVEALIAAMVESSVQYDKWLEHLWACWDRLSAQQQETALLLRGGYSRKEIAARMSIAQPTVKWRISKIMRTFGVHNTNDLLLMLREMRFE